MVARAKDARPSLLKIDALRDEHEWLDSYRELREKRFDRIDALGTVALTLPVGARYQLRNGGARSRSDRRER